MAGQTAKVKQYSQSETITVWSEASFEIQALDFCQKRNMALEWPSVKPFGLMFSGKLTVRRARSI